MHATLNPQATATRSWYELNSAQRSQLMAEYILKNNGPDSKGAAYPGVTVFKLSDIENALEIAKAMGLSRDFKPYHFMNVGGMKDSQTLADEVLIKRMDQLLETKFKGDLHTLFTEIDSRDLRDPLLDNIAGRTITVLTTFTRKLYGDTYSAVRKYLTVKGHHLELRDIRPYHLSRAARDTYKSEHIQDEVIRLIIDHLISSKFGTLDKLISGIQSYDFAKPVPAQINGKVVSVSPIKVFLENGSSVYKIVCKYIDLNGLSQRYTQLKPYHFSRAPRGTFTPEVIDKLILLRGDELFENKYKKNPEAFLAGISHVELFSPYQDYINGSAFEISLKTVREELGNSPWKFAHRYFKLKGMDDVLARIHPTSLARNPCSLPLSDKMEIYDSQIKATIENLLTNKFGGNLHTLIKNIEVTDIRVDNDMRIESALKACGSSVFKFVWRYLELTDQQEAFKDLRGYHFKTTAKDSMNQEAQEQILVKKLDELLKIEYQDNLPEMIASISVEQIATPLMEIINGEVYRVSCKSIRDNNTKFGIIKRYLELKGFSDKYKDLQPYHVGALGIFDSPEISDGLIKKRLDDLLANTYKNDIAAMISGISHEQITAPFNEQIADRNFEASLLRLYDYPETSSTFKIVRRYFELSDRKDLALEFKPYHLARTPEYLAKDYEELLNLKCQSLIIKYGGINQMLYNICTEDLMTHIPVKVAGLDLNVSFATAFGKAYGASPYLVARAFCQLNSIPFPYGKYCLTGSPQARKRKMDGHLSSRDRVKARGKDGTFDTARYGFRHFSSPGKANVRQQIVRLAGELISGRSIKFLGLETEKFELVRMLSFNHNFDAESSVIVEKDKRVVNAMKSFQQCRAKSLRGLKGIQIIEKEIESTILGLNQKFNLVHLDFFGHLTPRRLDSIGHLLHASLMDNDSLVVITLGNSALDQMRGANTGIVGSFQDAILGHLNTFSGFKVQHKFTTEYTGGEEGNGQKMISVFIHIT